MKLIFLIGVICFPPDNHNPQPMCTSIVQQYTTAEECIYNGQKINNILIEQKVNDYYLRCKEYDSHNKNY